MLNHLVVALRRRSPDCVIAPSLRAGVAVGVPLVGAMMAGWHHWVPYLTLGSLVALYGKSEPYRRRAGTLTGVGIGLVLAVGAGVWVAGSVTHPAARLLMIGVAAAVAKLLCDAGASGPPGGLILGFACATTAYLPPPVPSVVAVFAATSAGALFAWVVCMCGWVFDPWGPARVAVANALRCAATISRSDEARARHTAALAVHSGWLALAAPRERRAGVHGMLVRLNAAAESVVLNPASPDTVRGHQLKSAAARILRRRPPNLPDLPAPPFLNAFTDSPGSVMLRSRSMVAALHPRSLMMPGAVRVFLGTVVAGGVAQALHLGHGYWASVTAIAVLSVPSAVASVHRAVQRTLGTAVGLILALLVLSTVSSPLWVSVIVVGCVIVGEIFVVYNYGYGMVWITPTAVLLTVLAVPAGSADLTGDRLLATAVGGLVALGCVLAVRNRRSIRALESAIRACEKAVAEPRGEQQRRKLVPLVAAARDAYEIVRGEHSIRDVPDEELVRRFEREFAYS